MTRCAQAEPLEKNLNRYMQLSVQGQTLFGLRQEESFKLKLFIADQDNKLYLQDPWPKEGANAVFLF